MKRIFLICFIALCSVALFNRVTELTAITYVENDSSSIVSSGEYSVDSVAESDFLVNIVQHTSYSLPGFSYIGCESSPLSAQRRSYNNGFTKSVSDTALFALYVPLGLSGHKVYKSSLSSLGHSNDFYIYALRKIRV